ncbi:hypothetical protein NX059_008081 [Plenodomus lindquistii]|nr:hypothetical protein NX059_008081 [Plenodomus lindquistii]
MLIITLLTLLTAAIAIPVIEPRDDEDALIPGKYIVKFKNNVHINAMQDMKASIASSIFHEYTFPGFSGFAVTLADHEYMKIRGSTDVEYVQQDSIVKVSAIETQYNATWGTARISHHKSNCTTYSYDETAGEGTCAYVIDTGIEVDHPEFGGRAEFLVDVTGENLLADGFGHGTHVAGTIGSLTYGIAKKTKLFAVKVLKSDGYGTASGVLAGVNFVFTDMQTRRAKCPKGIVTNMSLGGPFNSALNEGVAALISSGVFVAAAAGNHGLSAEYGSPGSEPSVCTIAAIDSRDCMPAWSSWGPLVDILAPGKDITSTWIGGSTKTISGTSMAAPHVVGVAAYFLGLGGHTENGLCEAIVGMATKGVIDLGLFRDGTPNLLLWNGVEEGSRKRKRFQGAKTH